ncbi:antibiotic biosynthesis monooxygenase [Catellatospora sp. NPDC049111]|jgi:quinol monooxygenase YgiN|uniref:putative quinol monooxygenase n=1 Tax=unclassified Catellatospora TaxID=2645785 RepID=UPI0033D7CB6C
MATIGLIATLHAAPGMEDEVASFLTDGLPLVQAEKGTVAWFAYRIDASTFGLLDAFTDETALQAHLDGDLAGALMGRAGELLSKPPEIRKVQLLAAKLPA